MEFGKKTAATWPRKEHPMPETVCTTIMINVPFVLEKLFRTTSKLTMPKRDRDRVHLFRAGNKAAYLNKVAQYVELCQIPQCFHGEANEQVVWR